MSANAKPRTASPTALDAFLAGRVAVGITELATAFGFTPEHIRLEIERGELAALWSEKKRRVTADSIRAWHERGQTRRLVSRVVAPLTPKKEKAAPAATGTAPRGDLR